MADYKLNIFEALKAVDLNDGEWLSRQSPEARKAFAPPVFLRFASAIQARELESGYTIMMVNDRVNKHANEIMSQHPDLIFKLAASCGLGTKQDHKWIANSKRKAVQGGARGLIELAHPDAKPDEIDLLLTLYTEDEYQELADGSGLPIDEQKAAVKAFKKNRKANG